MEWRFEGRLRTKRALPVPAQQNGHIADVAKPEPVMPNIGHTAEGLDIIAHIIQEALTPIFLLSGIATLLSVFSTRSARVADQAQSISAAMAAASPDQSETLKRALARLHLRSHALDVAVISGALGAAATCGSVLTLFVGSLRDSTVAWLLLGLFGLAVIGALGGILAYTVEMLLAGIGVRQQPFHLRQSIGEEPPESPEPHNHATEFSDGSPPNQGN